MVFLKESFVRIGRAVCIFLHSAFWFAARTLGVNWDWIGADGQCDVPKLMDLPSKYFIFAYISIKIIILYLTVIIFSLKFSQIVSCKKNARLLISGNFADEYGLFGCYNLIYMTFFLLFGMWVLTMITFALIRIANIFPDDLVLNKLFIV